MVHSFIKEEIAYDLKDFWKYMTLNYESDTITIKGEINVINDREQTKRFKAKVKYDEFCILYEFLKGCDLMKIKAKYGDTNFKKMIGEKNEDQFILMASETIMTEINKLIKEREAEVIRLEEEHRRISDELWEKQKKEKEDTRKFYNEKIKELDDKIRAMRCGFKFTF